MIGEWAALSCALCWAIAARLFRILGGHFSPITLNFWKGLITLALLLLVTQSANYPIDVSNQAIMWLLLSGIIGIGLGDTFFFQAINKIGDSQTILVAETLAPIITALMAMAWISEWLSWQQWLGIAIVLFSVDLVIKVQRRNKEVIFDFSGYTFAGLAALCQAIGAVISRDILTANDIDPLIASQIRLAGAMAIILLLMWVWKQHWLPRTITPAKTWSLFFLATLIGTFAGLYLQMLAFANSKAAIVQTLFATSVVLSLLIAKVLGERVSSKTTIWSLMAFTGVAVLFIAS